MEKTTNSILVVEDNDALRGALVEVLTKKGFIVLASSSAEDATSILSREKIDCILCDFKLPRKNGIDLLIELRKQKSSLPFIIMTAYGSIEIAVDAMREGATDFITKPFDPELLSSNLVDVIKHNRIVSRSKDSRFEGKLLSNSEAMKSIIKDADTVAMVDTPVLLLGESGTGKELLAKHIHNISPRHEGPFVALNCGAIPEELLESELFGHEKGAFTGATQERVGLIEFASKGTLFLDEIGDMPKHLQVKLLRVLQDGEIRRLGSTKLKEASPRIITATNKDLREEMHNGAFREDLYYRIAVVSLEIPPLRERPEDVKILSEHFLEAFAIRMGREKPEFSKEANSLLLRLELPGNVRELQNLLQRALIIAGDEILPEHFGLSLEETLSQIEDTVRALPEIALEAARKAEITQIRRVLEITSWNRSKAAGMLGVSYKTLLNKIKEYQLETVENTFRKEF